MRTPNKQVSTTTSGDDRMNIFFMQAPAAIAILEGPDHIFTLANPRFGKLVSRNEVQLLGHTVAECFPELEGQGIYEMLRGVYESGNAFHGTEFPVTIRENGVDRPGFYDFIAHPMREQDGSVSAIMIHAVEMTEQVYAKRKIEESEQQFRLLADMLPQIVFTARADGYVDYYNKRWYEFTGLEVGYGDPSYIPALHPDDVQRCLDKWYYAVKTGTPYEIEYRFKDPKNPGQFRWFLGRALPVRDENNKLIKWFGTCTDIDEQRNFVKKLESLVAERTMELQNEKEYIETILNSSNDVIVVVDKQLRYLSGNTRMEKHYGVSKKDYVGKYVGEVFPGVEGSEFYEHLKKCLSGVHVEPRTYKSVVIDRWYQNSMVPMKDTNGDITGVIVVGHDVTDVMNVSEKLQEMNFVLRQKNRELELTNNDLESFNYMASHDLQEPLRKIQTFIELIHTNKDNPELAETYFSKIQSSAKRMSQLIKSILAYSRLTNKDSVFEEIDLNEVLNDVRLDFELLIKEHNATIDSDRLPIIQGVQHQFHQLFSNLLSNSIKFAKIEPEIKISARTVLPEEIVNQPMLDPKQQYFELQFIDNGIGFEQQYSEQIFQLFQRLHGKDEYSGTGIGLSIVKKIVQLHGGSVTADSVPGKGARFTIWFPSTMIKSW